MPTLNEAFATSFGETKKPPAANSLDAAFDTTFNDDETKLRANLHTAVRTDPVKIARADALAKETGLPTDMVARNLVNVELQRAVEKADSTLRTDPALLTKFKESDLFAKKARDDIDALVNVHGELKAWKGPDANFTNVVKGLAASLPQGLEIVRQGMGAQMGDFLEWAGLIERDDVYKKDRMRKMNQALGAGDFTRPDIESGTLRAVYGGAESTLRMLPGLAASVLTRNPTYALASAGLQSQGEAYAKYRGRGGAPLESFIGATGEGAVEVITEKLPTEFLTAAMGKKGFGEFITGLLAREVPTEQLATILQDAIDTAVANPDKTWSQYLAERPAAAYSTFISTVTQSALMGGAAVAVNRLSGQADKIAEAEANSRQLQKVLAATAQVKMREHSAGDFSQAMQSIAESEEGTRSSVFIDGEVLAQSVTIEELARVLPSAISQLEAAAATNGIVELPIGEVLANVQGTPLEQVLLQNARATPDAMTLAEAEDAVKLGGRWVEEAETLMQQAQDQDTIRASSEVVRKAVLEQLNTAGAVARRYRPSVNDALARVTAALFTTQAQRMNMTPEQLFVDSGFAVRGRGQGPTTKGRVLNADYDQSGELITDTPNFKNWFGDSKVVDDAGAPMVLYHGAKTGDILAFNTEGDKGKTSGTGLFMSADPSVANTYTPRREGGTIYPVYVSLKNPLIVDFAGKNWNQGDSDAFIELDDGTQDSLLDYFGAGQDETVSTDDVARLARSRGNDGVIIRNVIDNGAYDVPQREGPTDLYVAFEPTQVKSVNNQGAFDPTDPNILNQSAGFDQTQTEAFKRFSNDAPLVTADAAETYDFKTGEKIVVEAFHGTKRPDRVGTKFLKKRATSGPMAYHTSDPALASSYATGKQDTSLSDEDQSYETWFKYKPKGQRSAVDIVRAWNFLDAETKTKIAETAPTLRLNEDLDGVIAEEGNTGGNGSYDYNLSQTRTAYNRQGNPLKALVEDWLNSGNLFNEEETFMEVLQKAGFPMADVTYDSPTAEYPFVYKNYIAMQKPLVTSDVPQEVVDALNAAAKKDRSRAKAAGADMWDKNTRTLKSWVEAFNEPDNKYVWTSIPDKVTDVFRSLGYDGIVDWSGKGGGTIAPVYIPFEETQVKSALGNKGKFDAGKNDILRQGQQQGPRGTYSPRNFEIVLNENANLSTYFHELSHFYLDFLGRMAEMPGAPPEVVEDFNTFLGWAKVTPEQWREWRDFVVANPNKPLPKGMVKVHESLASAGEQYFLEGKAPNLELQPFMRRFARWMESVYRSLQQFIAGNPNKELQLNADIRRFFDRALATDEEIAQAEQAAGMLPDDDATAEAKERLNKRSMGDLKWSVRMRDGFIADLRKQAKEIRDSIRQTVTEEIDAMPAMQAKDALDRLMAASPEYKADLKAWKDAREVELARATEAVKAQLVAAEEAKTNAPLEGLAKGRFLSKNRAEVENKAEAAALEWEKQNPKPRRITPDMTPQMESIADKYGYTSVDQMLADIDATGSRRELIDGMTEQRMLEDHGDLIDERAIQQAANEAVHNDARARSLATELRTQQEMLGERADTGRTARNGRKITTNILLAAARNFATNVVGRAKILDLGNLAWKHNSAEARAGKRWQQLTSQGKTVEAVKAKQDQVLNNAAAKAAQEAQAEMRKLLDYVNKFDKESVRAKLPASYLDQIDKLRERVDLRVSTTRRDIDKRAALSKWIESQHALGLDPIVPDYLLDDAQLTSYKEMTVDQFREFADTIKNIEHLGRLKSKLLAAKDKREFDIIVAEIVQEIVANKGTPPPVQLEPDGRIKKFFKGAWADHRKLNSLVRQMDGGKDNGPLYRALVRSMNEAGTKENVMLEQATEAMAKIYAPIEKLPGGFSGASVYIPEINASLSRAGRLAIAFNWGNSTNRQRVMGGDNWTEAQVEAILATLSTTELEFVNNVWAQLDSYWPEMKAKQERVSGVVEDKVEAEPFELTAADGTIVQMRGGYYPIKYDSDRSLKSQKNEAQEVAADMLRGAILRPSTRRGHLKARVDEVNRPVRKDLSVITQHVNQVVHDLAWHEWLIDATRLLNDPRIAGSIRDYYGAETHRAMTDSMRAIAEGDIAHQTEIDKLLLLMRSNVTRSIMGASLTTALLQPFGLTQSMARIGVVPVLKGAWRWAGEGAQMQNSMKWIGEKSDFMRLRSKTFNRELREISQRVQGKSKFMQVADASLFFLMQKLQMVADVPTWIGAYEKALAGGVDDATAVQLADEAVLGSQGGGNTKDLAGVQRNLPFLTQFYSYFSTTLQLVAEKTALTDFKNPRAVAGWLGDMALLAVIPAILPALITYLLKGGGEDDEPEDWAKRLAEWQASYLLGMFVGLRELPAVWSPFDYQGPPAGKLINDGKRLVQQAGQGEIDDQAVLATIGFLGTALGIPTTQLVRSYKGWLAWDEGDAPPSSILFGPPPKD